VRPTDSERGSDSPSPSDIDRSSWMDARASEGVRAFFVFVVELALEGGRPRPLPVDIGVEGVGGDGSCCRCYYRRQKQRCGPSRRRNGGWMRRCRKRRWHCKHRQWQERPRYSTADLAASQLRQKRLIFGSRTQGFAGKGFLLLQPVSFGWKGKKQSSPRFFQSLLFSFLVSAFSARK